MGSHHLVSNDAAQAHQTTSNDPLNIPTGPITRARAKRVKEALNTLIQRTWIKQATNNSGIGVHTMKAMDEHICAIQAQL